MAVNTGAVEAIVVGNKGVGTGAAGTAATVAIGSKVANIMLAAGQVATTWRIVACGETRKQEYS